MLLHIIPEDDLARADRRGTIAPESLRTQGFVHCSFPEQVLIPANERFGGRTDLVLLVLDPIAIPHPIIVEDSDGSGRAFPHVYGAIPTAAIRARHGFPPAADGTFSLPPSLASDD